MFRRLLRLRRCHRQHQRGLAIVLVTLGLLLLIRSRMQWQGFEEAATDTAEESLVTLGPEPPPARPGEVAVVVLASRRPEVQLLVRQLLASRPAGFRLLVSQDGAEPNTAVALSQFGPNVTRLRLSGNSGDSYARISRHHLRVLDRIFLDLGFRHAVVMEDDLFIAPDFYSYFGTLKAALDVDPSLFCVSAWNDNGLVGLVEEDAALLHRTDFFPGLGWMTSRTAWLRVRSRWPETQFDDYLRRYLLKEGLVCVRPELSRTFNSGRCGGREIGSMDTYGRLFYQRYLSRVVLNQHNVSIPDSAIRPLLGREADAELQRKVRGLPEMTLDRLLAAPEPPKEVRLRYRTAREFVRLAEQIGIIPEVWFGAPRTSMRGIVSLRIRGCRVFIAPDVQLPLSDVIVSAADEQNRPSWLTLCGAVLLALGCLLALFSCLSWL